MAVLKFIPSWALFSWRLLLAGIIVIITIYPACYQVRDRMHRVRQTACHAVEGGSSPLGPAVVVAQRLVRRVVAPKVAGSIPSGTATPIQCI